MKGHVTGAGGPDPLFRQRRALVGRRPQGALPRPAGRRDDQPVRNRGWNFPDRTVLVKTFALEMEEGDPASRAAGSRRASSPSSRASGSATPTSGTTRAPTRRWSTRRAATASSPSRPRTGERKQTWHYPSRAECMVCHSRAANFVLGLTEVQMNKDHDYPNGRTDNQLRVLEHLGMLKVDWYARGSAAASRTSPQRSAQSGQRRRISGCRRECCTSHPEKAATLVDPARSEEGPGPPRPVVPARQLLIVPRRGRRRQRPHGARVLTTRGTRCAHRREAGASIVRPGPMRASLPGSSGASVLAHRVGLTGPGRMPPLATNRVDERGLALLRDWIRGLK